MSPFRYETTLHRRAGMVVEDEALDPGHLALHIVLKGMGHVVLEAREDFNDALMRCRDCFALSGEMRSAITEANALVEEAGVLIHASKPSEHFDKLRQIRERWQNTCRRWSEASMDLKNHCEAHESAPRLAKVVVKSL